MGLVFFGVENTMKYQWNPMNTTLSCCSKGGGPWINHIAQHKQKDMMQPLKNDDWKMKIPLNWSLFR